MSGRTKTFPVGLQDEQRKRWQAEADKRGVSLAEFVRQAVERDIALGLQPEGMPEPGGLPAPATSSYPSGGKEFKGPDPKVKPRPK